MKKGGVGLAYAIEPDAFSDASYADHIFLY